MSTWSSEASETYPLVFVTRQGKAVDSWTIPFYPPELALVHEFFCLLLLKSKDYFTPFCVCVCVCVPALNSSKSNIQLSLCTVCLQ